MIIDGQNCGYIGRRIMDAVSDRYNGTLFLPAGYGGNI